MEIVARLIFAQNATEIPAITPISPTEMANLDSEVFEYLKASDDIQNDLMAGKIHWKERCTRWESLLLRTPESVLQAARAFWKNNP